MTRVPPIKIQGIKTKAVPHIRSNIVWSGRGRWIEPFLGSAVVLLNVNPSRALVGDSNPHIIKFYQDIQTGNLTSTTARSYLEREGSELLKYGEDHYYEIRKRFNLYGESHDFLFLNRACFNGLMRFNKKGGFNTPFCRKRDRFRPAYISKICNQVAWVSEILKGKKWDFVCSDWPALLDQSRSGDYIYADPPYAGRHTDYYNSWDDNEASKLEGRLKSLPCPFMYSMWSENKYRRNDRLHREFSDYEIKTFSHFYHLGSTEVLRNGMTEALVIG